MNIGSSDGEKCEIQIAPKSAQSFIRFLLHREIRLLPPEGGVARTLDWQVETQGVPPRHSFFAYTTADNLKDLAAEWKASGSREVIAGQ